MRSCRRREPERRGKGWKPFSALRLTAYRRTAHRFAACRVLSCLLLMSIFLGLLPIYARAATWPVTELTAAAGIVMDADTGAVLFEKNSREKLYPASITKIMTALVVLKHAKLTDKVSFSHDAVYNVDCGSSNAQIEEGDVLTVEDCLYALLLKSANEAANALAEHISGSREGFAELMNEEAEKLGCTNTHFANPSGLAAENHYTTAEDMGKICIAAYQNEDFLKIEESRSHKLPAMRRVPEGLTIYMEHKMMLPNSVYYDSRVVAGKTGYTKASGNTLATLAADGDRHLVAVVLGDKNPGHYIDTKLLLDLGFRETENLMLSREFLNIEELKARLITDTIVEKGLESSALHIKGEMLASVPVGIQEGELSYRLNYNMPSDAPAQSVAEIQYMLREKQVGRSYLTKDQSIRLLLEEAPTGTKAAAAAVTVSGFVILGILGFLLLGGGAALGVKNVHDDRKLSKRMKERRRQRLEELHMTEEEFRALVEEKKKKGRG